MSSAAAPARLAELLGSLSLATDAAAALPPETAIRTALVAVRLGDRVGLQGFARADAYYAGLLRFLGCSAFAHEMAPLGAGDDLALLRALTSCDTTQPSQLLRAAWRSRPGAPTRERVLSLARLAADPEGGAKLARSHCELAITLARSLGMPERVVTTLSQAYERFDGRGAPSQLRGDAIDPVARILHVAWRVAAHVALEGRASTLALLHARRGREFDPALVDAATRDFAELTRDLDRPSAWAAFLAAEPRPVAIAARQGIDGIATAFGAFADVKSPWTTGHSAAVADQAARAAADAGLDAQTSASLVLAARLHDVGRVAIPNGIWDKPAALDAMERERMQTHAWETERILSRSPLLAPLARLAAADHERIDASGYPKGLPGVALDRPARLLAACDAFVAMQQDRPHRPALDRARATDALAQMARRGQLCPSACDVVLAGAGVARRRAALPTSLSTRELEVLRELVRGAGNKEIAAALHIAPATVKRHLENLYEKTGLRTRAAIAVWAMQHDLLADAPRDRER